ncbi:MAG: DUF2088 domain-containing protein [Candidimonas sp.]|nr:MAG: DUF2088 domain-containing protein [Candidimonas sp.]TAM24876.1 MAG: DUF2088 domain-containing protein [Candidimonas sp.]TAM74602.1 MAG: DUF2088 domain-containing protein [Candidimonas sp.]
MNMKSVAVDFGDRKLDIEVPESAVIAEFENPPLLEDPVGAVRAALAKPYGCPPLSELAKPGMRVAIGFDDPTRPNTPPQTILPEIIDVLLQAGVSERDIIFVNACSNHKKSTRSELANHLGLKIFNRFWPLGQILNHDCADSTQLKYFGITDGGRYVEMNRHFFEADLMIYQGNVASAAWKSYTGTGAVVGLASTRSIASHHSFHSIPDPGSKNSASTKRYGSVKEEMTNYLDQATGKQVFYINSINGLGGKMAGVFAGTAKDVKPPAWELAEKLFRRPVPQQADVLVVGLPQTYSYGSANNTLIAAVGALVPPRFSPGKPILREGGVVIAVSPTSGVIDERTFPSYPEAIRLYRQCFSAHSLVDYEDEFSHRQEYLHSYTHNYAYPAIHAFWLLYENEYTLGRASRVIMAGTSNPGAFRELGITPTANFADAWKIATRSVGPDPMTVVAPTFWSKPRLKFDVQS